MVQHIDPRSNLRLYAASEATQTAYVVDHVSGRLYYRGPASRASDAFMLMRGYFRPSHFKYAVIHARRRNERRPRYAVVLLDDKRSSRPLLRDVVYSSANLTRCLMVWGRIAEGLL
jgi:hypothetical protein